MKNTTNVSTYLFCNKCGSEINKTHLNYSDDFLAVKKRWNYHSDFDNEEHAFFICKECYKDFIKSFKISILK